MNSQGMYVGPPYHASYQINIFSTKHLFPPVRSSLGMRIAALWRQWNFVVDSFSFIKYICRWKQESFRVSHTPLHTYSTSPHAYSYNAHHTYNHFIHTLIFLPLTINCLHTWPYSFPLSSRPHTCTHYKCACTASNFKWRQRCSTTKFRSNCWNRVSVTGAAHKAQGHSLNLYSYVMTLS